MLEVHSTGEPVSNTLYIGGSRAIPCVFCSVYWLLFGRRRVDLAHNAAAAAVVAVVAAVALPEGDVVPLGGGQLRVVAGVGRGPVLALVQPNNLARKLLYQGPTQKRLELKFICIKRVGVVVALTWLLTSTTPTLLQSTAATPPSSSIIVPP